MKWPVYLLLLLAGAVVVPSEFAAMGAAPGQGAQTGVVAEAGEQAAPPMIQSQDTELADQGNSAGTRPAEAGVQAQPVTQPQETDAAEHDNSTGIRPAEPLLLAQSEAQPVWRQGSQGQQRTEPEIRRPSPAQRGATPAWRQGAAGPQEPPAQAQGATRTGGGQLRLFQSAAFRGNFNALPKWKRVLSKVKGEIQTLNNCAAPKTCPPGATSWQRIMKQARGLERMEQLKMVNSFFNKWPYRLDQDAYGVSDWWATPQEFLKISGDCEDYAIIKYFALKELGFSQDDLRIVVVKDRIRGIAHAVLAVFTHGDAYILNNVSDAIFTHDKYRHYVPQYSLNEEHRWSHIPVAN